ncbi:MAG: hypothetical protein KAW46_09105, partial [candidate division Zixibacteria bacterium]|nr:hypothetical protein [candidate division Zixibacteria bacterium]
STPLRVTVRSKTVHYGAPQSGAGIVLVHRHTPLLVPVSNVPNQSDRVYQMYADVLPINDSLIYSVVQGKTGDGTSADSQ